MRVLVTGAAGMLGVRLTDALRRSGLGSEPVTEFVLADRVGPEGAADREVLVGDISDVEFADLLASTEPDVVFHLAAVVSGQAEADVDLGYDVNVRGLWHLLEAARVHPDWRPRLVMASSVAVFGDADVAPLGPLHRCAPESSYGTQKAIGELLVRDYSRRGDIDGVAVRLATIVVRSAPPNAAASTFLSTIIRGPLAGQPGVIPVARTMRAWIASPATAVRQLLHAACLGAEDLADERVLTMPGLTVSVQDLVDAVERHGGTEATRHVVDEPDPSIEAIVARWPDELDVTAAVSLGFPTDRSVDDLVALHLDELERADDVTGMDFGRLAPTNPAPPTGANVAMTNNDDAAASVLAKVRTFIDTLEDDERQVFAAMLAPAVAEAWASDDDVAGFEVWTPTRVHDHLNRAIRDQRFRIERADPSDPI